MTLASRISLLATRIAEEFNAVRGEIAALGGADPFRIEERQWAHNAVPNSNAPSGYGIVVTLLGTATAAGNLAMTPVQQKYVTVKYRITTPAANAIASIRQSVAGIGPIDNDGSGGFKAEMIAGPDTGTSIATSRFFMGVRGSAAAPTDVNPSSLASIVGFGYDSADTNIQIMHNDASGTATKIDTGWARPTVNSASLYKLELSSDPSEGTVKWRATRFNTGAPDVITGTITTDLPTSSVFLAMLIYHSTGTSSTNAIGLAYAGSSGIYQLA